MKLVQFHEQLGDVTLLRFDYFNCWSWTTTLLPSLLRIEYYGRALISKHVFARCPLLHPACGEITIQWRGVIDKYRYSHFSHRKKIKFWMRPRPLHCLCACGILNWYPQQLIWSLSLAKGSVEGHALEPKLRSSFSLAGVSRRTPPGWPRSKPSFRDSGKGKCQPALVWFRTPSRL